MAVPRRSTKMMNRILLEVSATLFLIVGAVIFVKAFFPPENISQIEAMGREGVSWQKFMVGLIMLMIACFLNHRAGRLRRKNKGLDGDPIS